MQLGIALLYRETNVVPFSRFAAYENKLGSLFIDSTQRSIFMHLFVTDKLVLGQLMQL